MTKDLSPYLVVIDAAKNRTHIQDFYVSGRLSRRIDLGYDSRKQILSDLLEIGLVTIDGSRLCLGTLTECSWLVEGLQQGSLEAWEIVDSFPKKARKFNPDFELLNEIGLQGELVVIEELKKILPPNFHDQIYHVSLTDDSAGFDISSPSVINPDNRIFLEVKTSSRPGDKFNFYLSRNEFETAKSLKNWYLILVKLKESQAELFGYLESASLINYFPEDTTPGFRWTNTQGVFTKDDLRGLWP